MKLKKLINKKLIIFSITIWFILYISGMQDFYFAKIYELGGFQKLTRLFTKALSLSLIYIISFLFYNMYTTRKTKETQSRAIITFSYFAILMIFLLLTWPGAWTWDDVFIVSEAKWYNVSAWQHIFSGLFHIICLQIIPFPQGVIIIQSILSSFIVGYCIVKLASFINNAKHCLILKFVLFTVLLSPVLLTFILSGFRMGLYSYLELFLATKLFVMYKEGRSAPLTDLLTICSLTIIIGAWRSEAIYYPVAIFFVLLFMGKKIITLSNTIVLTLCSLVSVFGIGNINNALIGNDNYSLTATVGIMVELVRSADESDSAELAKIDKVMDVEYIINHPSATGETCFWDEECIKSYTEEEYSEYIQAYLKLALKYPTVALKAAGDIFVQTGSGLYFKSSLTNLYKNPTTQHMWKQIKGVDAIDVDFRYNVMCFLRGVDNNLNTTPLYFFTWNLFIPLILSIIFLIYKLCKKEFATVLIILTVLCRVPLIFLTASAPYFMYYASTYICMSIFNAVFIFDIIINLINKKKERKNENKPNEEKYVN